MSAAAALLAWYDRHRRRLPWRESRDPYRIWVSEVMLQQTRVEAVVPYFRRFLRRYPRVEDLAAAEHDELLALWSGLGYYRRARQMHDAARQIVAVGGFPRTVGELARLPGIGPYTAAAVASMAFGVAAPALDGNVLRVMCRLLGEAGDPRRSAVRRRLEAAAAACLDGARPGDSNQALMELGAVVCTPRRPRCLLCPLRPGCRAAAAGDPESYPPPRPRPRPVAVRLLVALVEEGGRLLLFRRSRESRLLAGTWELPWVDLQGTAAAGGGGEDERRVAAALADRYGGSWRVGPRLASVRHGITTRRIAAEVHRCRLAAAGVAQGPEAGWFSGGEIAALPVSSLVTKVVRAVRGGGQDLQPGV